MRFSPVILLALLIPLLMAGPIEYRSAWRAFLTGAETILTLSCPGDEVSAEIHYLHRRVASSAALVQRTKPSSFSPSPN